METSFEVVTILFNFHRWTCVVGPLALAMSLAKVSGIFSRLKKRLFLGVFIGSCFGLRGQRSILLIESIKCVVFHFVHDGTENACTVSTSRCPIQKP